MTALRRRPTPTLPDRLEGVYLIGICGTAMGSLAGMLAARGLRVIGSDRNSYPPMSDELAARRIPILPGWDGDNLRRVDPRPDLVVVGNVCRRDNPEVLAAAALGLPCVSLPEALRLIFLGEVAERVVVTGTHGKTTTSSMLAWILRHAALSPSFMIGGVVGNFGANFHLGHGDHFVIEGDEYDTAYFDKVPKFWHYEPTTLLINNIEFDHGDIYEDLEEIVWVFSTLAEQMPPDGVLFANGDDPLVRRVAVRAACEDVQYVGFGEGCTWRATQMALLPEQGARFVVARQGELLGVITLAMPGAHNVHNALMATAAAMHLGVDFDAIRDALDRFRGVKKRQEFIGVGDGVLVYDDFAHHPTAVRETVAAIRARHPDARLWALFEPKSNTSRRAIFQRDYPEALEASDVVIIANPWRADDLPPEQLLDLERVCADLEAKGVEARLIPTVAEIVAFVAARATAGDVVLGMSGGSFGGLHEALVDALQARARGEAPGEAGDAGAAAAHASAAAVDEAPGGAGDAGAAAAHASAGAPGEVGDADAAAQARAAALEDTHE